jgi:hypothetical protein
MGVMPDRENLGSLAVGDFFHALCPNGASLICLVTSVTETAIRARRVTTQEDFAFDRRTGLTLQDDGLAPCTIVSVAPLPADMHKVMLGLDRRYRLEGDTERFKLTDAEKQAFAFLNTHYPTNSR